MWRNYNEPCRSRDQWGKPFLRQMGFLMLFVLALTGCTHTVGVALRPNYENDLIPENELTAIQPAIKFGQGEFSDKRADKSKLTTFKQGIHTYNLYEERSFKEALFEGIKTMIEKSGHRWSVTGPGKVRVDLQLLSIHAARNEGFFNVGATSGIQLKLDFVEPARGNVIYTQVYNGTDERKKALIGPMDMVKKSIDASIVDCLNKMSLDEDLSRALEKFNQTSASANR